MNRIFTLTLQLILTSALTLFSHTVFSQGSGHALNFDGNDYVRADGISSTISNSSVTVTCWYRANTTNFGTVFAFNTSTGNNRILVYNNAIFEPSIGFNMPFTTTITDGNWHHISYVLDNGSNTAKVFIDGIEDISYSTTTSVAANDRFSIGQEWDGNTTSAFIDGNINEVTVWDRVLTEAEIRENMCQKQSGSEPNLVAYFRMDEGIDNSCSGGEDVCDLTGNGNHGTKF